MYIDLSLVSRNLWHLSWASDGSEAYDIYINDLFHGTSTSCAYIFHWPLMEVPQCAVLPHGSAAPEQPRVTLQLRRVDGASGYRVYETRSNNRRVVASLQQPEDKEHILISLPLLSDTDNAGYEAYVLDSTGAECVIDDGFVFEYTHAMPPSAPLVVGAVDDNNITLDSWQ